MCVCVFGSPNAHTVVHIHINTHKHTRARVSPTVPPLQKTALMPLKRNPPDGGFGGNKGTGTIALKGGYGVVMGHGTSWQAPAYK
jgi:hypothetical protein